jgi:adenylyltransferase/sulfurtransferase
MSDDRYARQRILAQVGDAGQSRLASARVVIVGLGALGCPVADLLARAGVGELTLIDRDLVEMSNLQRQTLYSSADVGQPKALAAAARVAAINPTVRAIPRPIDVNSRNAEEIARSADVIVDATDNAQSRYLINDVSLKLAIPWVYGGAVGTEGRATGFRPSAASPCLRCLFRDPPSPGELPTCDSVGVLNTLTATIGAMQAHLTLRMLIEPAWTPDGLLSVKMWDGALRWIDTAQAKEPTCSACGQRRFDFLNSPAQGTATLCGHGTVQVLPPTPTAVDLAQIAERWELLGSPLLSRHLLRLELPGEGLKVTLFADGRLLIRGLDSVDGARGIYDRLVGS